MEMKEGRKAKKVEDRKEKERDTEGWGRNAIPLRMA